MTSGVSQSNPNPITEQMEREKKTPKEGNGLGPSYSAPKNKKEERRVQISSPWGQCETSPFISNLLSPIFFFFTIYLMKPQGSLCGLSQFGFC